MGTRTRLGAVATALLLAGTLAACGGTSGGGGEDETAEPAEPTASSSEPTVQTVTVGTAQSDLGTILVDGDGMTLYLFTADSPGVSTCEDACLAAWPPLLGEPEAGEGADSALLGTLVRSDGSTQVSYDGWPLYYWAQDAAPGDTSGQGVNDVWWVVSPSGEAIGAP